MIKPRRMTRILIVVLAIFSTLSVPLWSRQTQDKPAATSQTRQGSEYSGTYAFLRDGEFVQVTVEDAGRVTGFVSRYGESDSDKGAFLDQFFKEGKLDQSQLTFTTQIVHGVSYEFKGSIERGEGKKAGDEAYYQLHGTLIETTMDANKKSTSRSRGNIQIFPARLYSSTRQKKLVFSSPRALHPFQVSGSRYGAKVQPLPATLPASIAFPSHG